MEDKRRVDPTKAKQTRVIKNPRFVLNPARLTGPRGIQVIPDHFKDFKFKGKYVQSNNGIILSTIYKFYGLEFKLGGCILLSVYPGWEVVLTKKKRPPCHISVHPVQNYAHSRSYFFRQRT